MGSKKSKGLFVEGDAYTVRSARVSGLVAPLRVDTLSVTPISGLERIGGALDKEKPVGRGRYIAAHCGFAAESRFYFLHKVTQVAKAREAGYWAPLLRQARLDPEEVVQATLDAATGTPLSDIASGGGAREFLVCGAKRSEWKEMQEQLVSRSIVPQSLQLSGLSTVAGLLDYLKAKRIELPVLLLEMSDKEAHLFILAGGKVVLCRAVSFGYESVLPLIRSELGLKDEESARHLFFSNTFDFRDIGNVLFGRLLRDLNAASGFYEMQTGQPLHGFVMTGTPAGLDWVPEVIAEGLEIGLMRIDWETWLERHKIELGEGVEALDLTLSMLPLMTLMMDFSEARDEG